MTKEIGAMNRNGHAQIVDTNWDHNGTLAVTVREMIGQPIEPNLMRSMAYLAKGALKHAKRVKRGRTIWSGGSNRVTFYVSR